MATAKKQCKTRLNSLNDITSEVCRVYRMMKEGTLPAKDGSKFVYALQQAFNMREKIDTARAIQKLEAQIAMIKEGQTHVGDDDEIAEIAKGLQ